MSARTRDRTSEGRAFRASARAALLAAALAAPACGGGTREPSIELGDVRHFVAILPMVDTSRAECPGLERYFEQPSEGLSAYNGKYSVGPLELCAAIRRWPERYVALAGNLRALDSVRTAATAAFARFAVLYPDTRFVPTWFVVGNGISGGTTIGGLHPAVLIGAELVGNTANLPRTMLHELVHVQQAYPLMGAMTGGPAFLRGSLLRHAIKEGAADFLAELVMGPPPPERYAWLAAHEAELWRDFQRDMRGKDYSGWIYNGWNRANLGDRPPDAGYYIGYRITQAWYARQADKAAAIRGILHIRDFGRFLAESGYGGGSNNAR